MPSYQNRRKKRRASAYNLQGSFIRARRNHNAIIQIRGYPGCFHISETLFLCLVQACTLCFHSVTFSFPEIFCQNSKQASMLRSRLCQAHRSVSVTQSKIQNKAFLGSFYPSPPPPPSFQYLHTALIW